MIKYAVFDWDGTLADTYPVINGAYAHVFKKMKQPVLSVDEIKQITSSKQNKDTFTYLFGDQAAKAKEVYYEYIEKYHTSLTAMPYAKELLDFCKSSHMTALLLTNKKTKYVMEELKVLEFDKYFSKIVAAGEYQEDKPHRIACEALFDGKLPPSNEIIVVGDGKADVEVAKVYGAKSIIYQGKIQGDYNINSLSQAIEIMKGL